MSLKDYSALCLGALFVFSTGPQTLFAQDVNRREAVCEAALRYFFTDEVPAGAKTNEVSLIPGRLAAVSYCLCG
jgi:hypothetical protein